MVRTRIAGLFVIFALMRSATSRADVVCPDSSYCTASFSCRFTGLYQKGQPLDRVLVVPNGSGETFSSVGITIRVYLKNCSGAPLAGVPARDIVLAGSSLCNCSGETIADGPTDSNGVTTFNGPLKAGGCAESLSVIAQGVPIGSVPVKTTSPDLVPASPCFVDASDHFGISLGRRVGQSGYTICKDLNRDGYIDISDLATFTERLGARCN